MGFYFCDFVVRWVKIAFPSQAILFCFDDDGLDFVRTEGDVSACAHLFLFKKVAFNNGGVGEVDRQIDVRLCAVSFVYA